VYQDPGSGREFRLRHENKRGDRVQVAWEGQEFPARFPRRRPERFHLMLDSEGRTSGFGGPNCMVILLVLGLVVQSFQLLAMGVPTIPAVVVSIGDTGKLVNFDPVVDLVLQLTGVTADPITLQSIVSKLRIPAPVIRYYSSRTPPTPVVTSTRVTEWRREDTAVRRGGERHHPAHLRRPGAGVVGLRRHPARLRGAAGAGRGRETAALT
jgi:hypothetical protein